jgi:hypothetical protein
MGAVVCATRSWNAFGSMLSDFDCGILGDIRCGQSYRLPCRQCTSLEIRRQSDEERSAVDCDGYSPLSFFHISFPPPKKQVFKFSAHMRSNRSAHQKKRVDLLLRPFNHNFNLGRSFTLMCVRRFKTSLSGSSLNAAEQETSGLTFFKTFLGREIEFVALATQTSHAALGWVFSG